MTTEHTKQVIDKMLGPKTNIVTVTGLVVLVVCAGALIGLWIVKLVC